MALNWALREELEGWKYSGSKKFLDCVYYSAYKFSNSTKLISFVELRGKSVYSFSSVSSYDSCLGAPSLFA